MRNILQKTKKLVGNKKGLVGDVCGSLGLMLLAIVCMLVMDKQFTSIKEHFFQPQIIAEAKIAIDENSRQNTKIFKFTPTSQYSIQSDAKKQISDYAEERGWVSVPIKQDDESYIVFHRKE